MLLCGHDKQQTFGDFGKKKNTHVGTSKNDRLKSDCNHKPLLQQNKKRQF